MESSLVDEPEGRVDQQLSCPLLGHRFHSERLTKQKQNKKIQLTFETLTTHFFNGRFILKLTLQIAKCYYSHTSPRLFKL